MRGTPRVRRCSRRRRISVGTLWSFLVVALLAGPLLDTSVDAFQQPIVTTQRRNFRNSIPCFFRQSALQLEASRVDVGATASSSSIDRDDGDDVFDNNDSYSNPPAPPIQKTPAVASTATQNATTMITATAMTNSAVQSMLSGTRLRRLKDLMWVREALEDLTAAEFAGSVEAYSTEEEADSVSRSRRRKRAVDYEKLLLQLNKRLRDMGCAAPPPASGDNGQAPFRCTLTPGVGMGSVVYSDAQRQALLRRILRTRLMLCDVIRGYNLELSEEQESGGGLPFSITLPEIQIPKEADGDVNAVGPKLYVRDDGTVDWDGALQDQAALRKFGTAVWARINGREPETLDVASSDESDSNNTTMDDGSSSNSSISSSKQQVAPSTGGHAAPKPVTARIVDTAEIKEARSRLDELSAELTVMEASHTALLNSAIFPGNAVANVNLAALNQKQRQEILESAEQLEFLKERVTFHRLFYELERIYTYLAGELGNPALKGYISLQDRLNVAEFGLLESQTDGIKAQLDAGELIDADVLAVLMDQVADFKRRLGIDYLVTGVTFDREAIQRWLGELWDKTRNGLAFYVKGCRLFWNDIVYCLSLINRAAQGYTLKPREVQTIRRAFKDVVTFVPFVIILIIPLTPIGHVFVFTAIQRFFPEFFPSCFTEQRQNLLQLYENAEYSEFTINETWKAKLARLFEAFLYFAANTSRSLYLRLVTAIQGDKSDQDDENPKKR